MEFFSSLTGFDTSFAAVVLISVLFGFMRGFIKSLISLVGWIVAAFIAVNFSDHFIPYVTKYGINESVATIVAMIETFVVTALIIAIVNSFLTSMINCVCGGLIDRIAGLLLGFVRGGLIASVLFFVLNLIFTNLYITSNTLDAKTNAKLPAWARNSKTIVWLSRGSDLVTNFVSKEFELDLHKSLTETVPEKARMEENTAPQQKKINSVKKLIASMPKDFVDEIPADELITVQDESADKTMKASILKDILRSYNGFIQQDSSNGKDSDEIIGMFQKYIKQYSEVASDSGEKKQ